jgi:hypothetical protein
LQGFSKHHQPGVKCLTWTMLMFKHLEQVFLSKS